MDLTFRHDGTGVGRPRVASLAVTITAAAHTYHSGQRQSGRNWLTWSPFRDECWYADTFAEAVYQAAELAGDMMGGCVLVSVAGVAVAPEWDAVALLAHSRQADPPFSDWLAVVAEVAGAVCPECRVPVDAMPGEPWPLCGLCAALQPPAHYGPPDHIPA